MSAAGKRCRFKTAAKAALLPLREKQNVSEQFSSQPLPHTQQAWLDMRESFFSKRLSYLYKTRELPLFRRSLAYTIKVPVLVLRFK
ncbi:hypothetical protein ACH95_13150 [Bacillus glycinifermentans]|uniref:Uncharacterized protein n=1 Tax=Bacillus glycinifermentans TaxID=1664069 RepID=A0A0J6ELU4_9BACI|nr:hypothetical protein COP00_06195 [Bacillus glycinifermentans]KMM58573.1 hypothetical protein ACH95_13150 [Bacillus glycinifermentans]KRT95014.1 hypothetical protein AB447_210795 [Bacillus glycinifermentans]